MDTELLKELLEIFPNKILKDFTNKINLKKELKKRLEKEIPDDISIKQFLINNYNFIDSHSSPYDYSIIKILSECYEQNGNYRRKIFEQIENVKRQRIEQKLKKTLEKQTILNWEIEELNDLEKKVFFKLIETKKFEIENEEMFFFIFQNGKECLILVYDKKNKRYKAIINQNNYYIQKLIYNHFHKYYENDFSNIEYLKKINNNGYVQVNSKDLKESPSKKKMIICKYIEFLGFKYINPNKLYDDNKILEILKRNIYPGTEKDVYIPTDSKDAQLLRRLGSRSDDGIENFITKFGFVYHKRDSHLRILKTLSKFSNNDKEIYLSKKGNFYNKLCQNASKKNLSLENYIKSLGFIKIEDKSKIAKINSEEIDAYYNELKIQREITNCQLDKKTIEFIENIENNLETIEKINEKEALIKQRLTQGLFRKNLLERKCKCEICDIEDESFLIASHIKPWSASNNQEKTDINNGFLFCPNHDKLFDNGYISFENDGKLKISEKLTNKNIKQFNLDKNIRIIIKDEVKKYLEYHRAECFKDK